MEPIAKLAPRRSHGIERIVRSFLGSDSLSFADVLSAERIQRIFEFGIRALQVAGDGASRVLDNNACLQPDSHDGIGRGFTPWQASSSD